MKKEYLYDAGLAVLLMVIMYVLLRLAYPFSAMIGAWAVAYWFLEKRRKARENINQ